MVEECSVLRGFAVVVVDRGFVYVGDIVHDGKWCVITEARNIRKYGTTRGLGELVLSGPLENTKLDPMGTIRVPGRAVISVIDTEKKLWN